MTASEWADQIRAGDIRALARAATLVENGDARELLAQLAPHRGHAVVAGITGPPGAGKSTLMDRLTAEFRAMGKTVAIVAVDPSSPYTQGAILGDRIRMQAHSADRGVFIRSMATRGAMGGLARSTAEMVALLDAAGRDVVLVETVGVGQDEVDIARLGGLTVVVLVPGLGDDVQALKSGILEIAGLFVINKADQPGVEKLEREIHSEFDRPIFRTVAPESKGIAELAAAILTQSASAPSLPPAGAPAVSLRAPDFHATLERLRRAGAEIVDGPRPGPCGRQSAWVRPGNVLLEITSQESGED